MEFRLNAVSLLFLVAALAGVAFVPARPALAQAEFTPDTLWVSARFGDIFEVTLTRNAQGVPQSAGVALFASVPGGISPGLAFFNAELYYASAFEGAVFSYLPDSSRTAYATGFPVGRVELAGLLFDSLGTLLVAQPTFPSPFMGQISAVPLGGGSAPFPTFLATAQVNNPIAAIRDSNTDDVYVADWQGGDDERQGCRRRRRR